MPAEILNQDEIDALLKGVDDGAVPTTPLPEEPGKAREYDLATQTRIVRGRMPTLEMINDRFARLFRIGLFNMIRRTPEIAVAPVRVQKFSEYVQNLHVPSSLNM
ncbi:MAG TPA: flagellar motor switch protein FliM, partial [Steroidobacteraceae bacterium]